MKAEAIDLAGWAETWRPRIDAALAGAVPPATDGTEGLMQAARFGLLGPAKRVRALLVLATVEDAGGDLGRALEAACAIEMVHAASLILDDMPCMDNANLRRERETTHRKFGESTAILAAIGLIARANEGLATERGLGAEIRVENVARLARAMGFLGLTGGQYLDLNVPGSVNDLEKIADLYHRKTGALFGLAMSFGATIAELSSAKSDVLDAAGNQIGLAFQIYDDLIDAFGTRSEAGKDVRMDTGKATAITVLGADGAARHAEHLIASSVATIGDVIGHGRTAALVLSIADRVAGRIYSAATQENRDGSASGETNG